MAKLTDRILSLLEALMRIIDATQELEISYVGSRRRDYVQSVCESIRSNQWFPKKHEPILDGWEESDLDSGLAESLYKESEAEVDLFLATNLCGLLRSTQSLDPNLLSCQQGHGQHHHQWVSERLLHHLVMVKRKS